MKLLYNKYKDHQKFDKNKITMMSLDKLLENNKKKYLKDNKYINCYMGNNRCAICIN